MKSPTNVRNGWLLAALMLALLAGCLPALAPRQASPAEASLLLEMLEPNLYQTTFLPASPAVCITGQDGAPVCTTFVITGSELATNETCRPHPSLEDALECIVPEEIPRGYRITFASSSPPYVVVGFFLRANLAQPLYLEAP
jgi:hypothetical protein